MAAGAASMNVQQQLPFIVSNVGSGTALMRVMKKTKGAHQAETKETDATKPNTIANPRIRQRQEAKDHNKAEIVNHGAAVDNAHENSRLAAAKKAEANAEAMLAEAKAADANAEATLALAKAEVLEAEALYKKARMYASAANLDSQALLDEAKKLVGCRGATKPEWSWWNGY